MSTRNGAANSSPSANFDFDLPPHAPPSSSALGGTGGAGILAEPTQACAACKFQHRKCTPDCILAPYFPGDKPRLFLSARRLFGLGNILKTIRGLDENGRDAAMRNIVFHSFMRAEDPVRGCYKMILDLQRKIDDAQLHYMQLQRVLDFRRAQTQEDNQPIRQDQTARADPNPDDLPPQQRQQEKYDRRGGNGSGTIMNPMPAINPTLSWSPVHPPGSDLGRNFNSVAVDREEEQKEVSLERFRNIHLTTE